MAKRGRKPKRRLDLDNLKGIFSSAFSLLLLVLGVVSAISVVAGFGGGSVNSLLRQVLIDGFGFAAIFVPPILIYGGLLMIGTFNWKFLNYRVFAGLILFFLSFAGMFGMWFTGNYGMAILRAMGGLISVPGAAFLYFATTIFSVVLITNMGVSALVEKLMVGIDWVKYKFFHIKMPDNLMDDEEGEESEEGEVPLIGDGEDAATVVDSPLADPDASVEGAVTSAMDATAEILTQERDFEILKPPSEPVDEIGPISSKKKVAAIADAKMNEKDEEMAEDFEEEIEEVEEKRHTSLARLPFSNRVWEYPPSTLLNDTSNQAADAGNTAERSTVIENTLEAFGIQAKIDAVNVGPAVTQYAIKMAQGTKAAKVKNLSTDLALALKSPSGSVRIEAPIPGTNLVGIEIPNFSPSSVSLRSVMESEDMKGSKSKLAIPLGHDVGGKAVIQDISRWPHALVAGATGSGKSVMLNAMISALLFRCSPSECRFIMIDPKMVELSQYNGIPHLLTPVVTDIEQKAVSAFAWAVSEMERRYKLFASAGVRDITGYNKLSGFQAEPYIVIVVDELADMMMVAASEVEKYITRLAQKSRAVGIHLILATQRPSVNILTGTIKANVPTRIAFKVTSNVDSRVIIDQMGAETLIGRGDMLFVPPDDAKPRRIQGVYVADDEINRLVSYLKEAGIEPDYKEEIVQQKVLSNNVSGGGGAAGGNGLDPKVVEAIEIVINDGKASASYLQRKIGVGYSRAARIIDDMEAAGIVGQSQGSKPRDVLIADINEAINRMGGDAGDDSDSDDEEIVS